MWVTIIDILGREIIQLVQEQEKPGFSSVLGDARDRAGKPVSVGVYLYHVQAGDYVQYKEDGTAKIGIQGLILFL